MKIHRLLFAFAALAFGGLAAVAAEDDVRFSKTLLPAELSSLGLAQLSSDQLAVLDALVRRDIAQSRRVTKRPPPAKFSDRLSADERRDSGLDLLGPAQRDELDRKLELLRAPADAGTWSMGLAAQTSVVPSVKIRRGPEIHGTVELMVGAGSHGYSEYGGAMTVAVEDPGSGFTFAVSYAELHTKGGYLYRDCRRGYWSRPGDMWW